MSEEKLYQDQKTSNYRIYICSIYKNKEKESYACAHVRQNSKLSLQRMFVTNALCSFLKRQRRNKKKHALKRTFAETL